ncbi:MAG: DNA-binding NarL/FixJ family response regulator [Cyclobacteriaceae bacterium]|jgi:DNA-binding NarL/FixJ family response regulator
MTETPIRLLLVDDHELFLEGIISLLSGEPSIVIQGTAANGKIALEKIRENQPDVLITDLSMPEMGGIDLVKKVKAEYTDIKILVLTMHNDRATISEIMMAEAEGYVLKNTDRAQLVKAITKVADGGMFYCNEVAEVLLERLMEEKKREERVISLTDREQEILKLIAEEMSSEEIANELFISRRTVETHRKNMLKKAEANTVIGLLKYGVRFGLISL